MYSRSPAAYQALRSFKLLQLPCVRTLKFYIDSNLEGAGDSVKRLQQCRVHYNALIEEKEKVLEENSKRGNIYSMFVKLVLFLDVGTCIHVYAYYLLLCTYFRGQDFNHKMFCPQEKVL